MTSLVWRFAGFEYSPLTGLNRDGATIQVGPQARQLLELLLEANGAVVPKAEIAEKLWPGRAPSDDSIDRCAYLLRKPLRDAGCGDLIATSYGRGLALRAKIEIVDPRSSQRASGRNIDGRIRDLWHSAFELASGRTRDQFMRAQEAVDGIKAVSPDSPEILSLSIDLTIWRAMRGYLEPAQMRAAVERDAKRALEIEPEFPSALAALGWVRAVILGKAEGLALLDRAIELDPHCVQARLYRAWALTDQGRLDDGAADVIAGLTVSDLDEALIGLGAWLEICRGNRGDGEKLARQGLEQKPHAVFAALAAAIAASLDGRHDDAERLILRNVRPKADDPLGMSALAYIQAMGGAPDAAEKSLSLAQTADTTPCTFEAAALLTLGRRQEATELMEQRRAEGCPWFAFAAIDPRLETMQDDIVRIRSQISPLQG